ncbi:MAG: hypothetical protein K0Q65_3409 [Clostridia bacterium]|nr:hypothetical protein [Clostridia bacterium]
MLASFSITLCALGTVKVSSIAAQPPSKHASVILKASSAECAQSYSL